MLRGRTASDFLVTSSGNLAIAVFSALGGILAARLLGPEGRGELAAAVVWASILGVIAQLGLPQALAYYSAAQRESVGAIFKAMLLLCALQSVVILLIGWVAVHLMLFRSQPSLVSAVRIYLFSIPLSIPVTYMATIAQGMQQFKIFRTLRVVPVFVYVLSFVVAYLLRFHATREILYTLLLGQFLVSAWAFRFFWVHVRPTGSYDPAWLRKLLRYGLMSYGGSLSWMANARVDQFVMSALVSSASLGHYSVAVSYAGFMFPLLGAVPMVLFPYVASSSRQSAGKKIIAGLGISLLLSITAAIVLGLLSRFAIPWLFGAEFAPATRPAVVLLVGTVMLGASYVLSDGLRGLERPLVPSIGEMIGLVVTLVALYLLLPRLGIIGAAWASVLSYSTTLLFLVFGLYRTLKGLHEREQS